MAKCLQYGGVPVPYTVSWTAEERSLYVAPCRWANGRMAIRQKQARGDGKPLFGAPHMDRQREAVARCLCDLCGKPLQTATKVSLSHARPQPHAARPMDVLQFEPLLHKRCAAICLRHCPSLKRDIRAGTLMVRQVFQHRAQLAIYSAEGTFEATGTRIKSVSHAKVQLVMWKDRNAGWLGATDA